MKAYKDLIDQVMAEGTWIKNERTGEKCKATSGLRFRHDMRQGFPMITVKKQPFYTMARELEGFIKGKRSKEFYQSGGCKIWDPWCNPKLVEEIPSIGWATLTERERDAVRKQAAKLMDDLGPIYGAQWRDFGGVDQLGEAVRTLKTNPTSRRILVSAWNPPQLGEMALPPCHFAFQLCYRGWDAHAGVAFLDLVWYQRSADMMIGVPFNIASYGLLLHLICWEVGMQPGNLTGLFGDIHIYEKHFDAALTCMNREPRPLPQLARVAFPNSPLFDFYFKSVNLEGYDPHPAIILPVAV